jgi:hypothetical protein
MQQNHGWAAARDVVIDFGIITDDVLHREIIGMILEGRSTPSGSRRVFPMASAREQSASGREQQIPQD